MKFQPEIVLYLGVFSIFLSCEVNSPQLETIHSRHYISLERTDTSKVTVTYIDTNILDTLLSPLDSLFPISLIRIDSIYADSIVRTVMQNDSLYDDGARFSGLPDTTYDTLPATWVFTSSLRDTIRRPRFDTAKIMPLGNSITQGDSHANYRRFLWYMLDSAGYAADFTGSVEDDLYRDSTQLDYDPDHEGWSGWTTHDLLDSLPDWSRKQNPDIVLCHAGTNNSSEDLETVILSVQKMILAMRAANPNIIILLAQITPMDYSDDWVVNYNKKIGTLGRSANTKDSPIVVVDHHSGMDVLEHFSDGVHPNSSGCKIMARTWFQSLTAAF